MPAAPLAAMAAAALLLLCSSSLGAATAAATAAPAPFLILPLRERPAPHPLPGALAPGAPPLHLRRRRSLLGSTDPKAKVSGGLVAAPLGGGPMRGYFSARIELGTPPRPFDLIVDTGSSLTYVTCAGCHPGCGKHMNAPFDPAASSTAREVPCAEGECLCGTSCADTCPLPLPPMLGRPQPGQSGSKDAPKPAAAAAAAPGKSGRRRQRRRLHGEAGPGAPIPSSSSVSSAWAALRALIPAGRIFVDSSSPAEMAAAAEGKKAGDGALGDAKDTQSWRPSKPEAQEQRAKQARDDAAEARARQGGAPLAPRAVEPPMRPLRKPEADPSAAAAKPQKKVLRKPDRKMPCSYAVFYAEGSSTTGRVLSDVLHVPMAAAAVAGAGGKDGKNASSSSPSSSSSSYYSPRVQFGCAATEDGMLRTQAADGILGLGNSADTVVGQLAGSGATAGAGFGVCLSHPSGGAVLLGAGADDVPAVARAVGVTGEMKYVPLLRDRHFAVAGGRMLLGGKEIPVLARPPAPGSEAAERRRAAQFGPNAARQPLSPAAQAIEDSALEDEAALWDSYYDAGAPKKDGEPLALGRTVVDSGATWSYLPFGKAVALERALQRVADARPPEQAPGLRRLPPDFLPEELCWRSEPPGAPAASVYAAFPRLTLELGPQPGGLALELAPEAYLYPLYDIEVPPESVPPGMGGKAKSGDRGDAGGGKVSPAAAALQQQQTQQQQQQQQPQQKQEGVGDTAAALAAGGRRRLAAAGDAPPSAAQSRRLTMGDVAEQEVKGVYCLAFMRSAEEWSLLGGAALRGRLTHFDLTRQRLGLATATCRIDADAVASVKAAREGAAGPGAAKPAAAPKPSAPKPAAAPAKAPPQQASAAGGAGRRRLSTSASAAAFATALVARAAA